MDPTGILSSTGSTPRFRPCGPIVVALQLLVAGPLLRAAPPDAGELAQFPPTGELPGQPPESGTRYWQTPWQPLSVGGCYVSVHVTGEPGRRVYELWQNAWGDTPSDRTIVVRRGPSLEALGPPEVACAPTLISDVPDPRAPASPAPNPGYTRPALTWDRDYGHVLLTCVCPDYKPGSVPLLPAVLTSRTGAPGSFTYLGKAPGDTAAEAARRTVWSDGGSLVRLPDGHWRLYVNGFGQVLSLFQAERLEGPWRSDRTPEGSPRELLPDFPKARNRGGCFPTVLRVTDTDWHLWITDTWVPQSIWHFWSADGLTWGLYGRQPEITRAAVEGHGIKCLRAYLDPETGDIVGLLSVWGTRAGREPGWELHRSRMPPGAPPRTEPVGRTATPGAP